MIKKHLAVLGAASLWAGAATADVDRLSEQRLAQIEQAFNEVLDRPATEIDAISQEERRAMLASYDALGSVDSAADQLSQDRLTMMQSAYAELDAASDLPIQ